MTPGYAALVRHVEACQARGRLDEAESALRAIVQANPREHYAWGLLAQLAVRRGDAEGALDPIQRAIRLERDNPEYLNLLGVACAELGRFGEALASLRKAVRARPAHAEAHFNIGKVLDKQGDLRAAQDAFRRAAALDPRYPGARYMLGRALVRLGEFDAAIGALERAVADDPADDWCVVMLGRALAASRGHAATIDLYRQATRRLPASGMLHRNLAHALLAAGEFREGWAAYIRRDCQGPAPRAELPGPLAHDLSGRTLVLRPEQGLGDVLFFLRFASAAAERGARIAVVAPPKLAPLLVRVPWFASVVSEGSPGAPAGDVALAVPDLPFAVGEGGTPPALPLTVLPERVSAWRERLAAFGPAPYVGVTWRAGTDFRRRTEFGANIQSLFKEVPPDRLAGALRRAPGTLVSLQRQPDAEEVVAFASAVGRPVFDAAEVNEDLEEALALLATLDEYVGVSSTNLHLRAGLGRSAHVLVPYPPEWRWMAEGERSPWFRGIAAYRESPIRSMKDALFSLGAALAAPA